MERAELTVENKPESLKGSNGKRYKKKAGEREEGDPVDVLGSQELVHIVFKGRIYKQQNTQWQHSEMLADFIYI